MSRRRSPSASPLDFSPPPAPPDRGQVIEVAARYVLALAGLLLFGWPAQTILLLYFFDTVAAIWALMSGLLFGFFDSGRQSAGTRWYTLASALALAALPAGFIALPLGMPIAIMLMASQQRLETLAAQPGFVPAVIVVFGLAMISAVRWSVLLVDEKQARRLARAEFGLLFGRWVLVMPVLYTVGTLLGPLGALLAVLAYTALSIVTDLYPQRFLRAFNMPTDPEES